MRTISTLLLVALGSLAAACGSDSGSSATPSAPSVDSPTTTGPAPSAAPPTTTVPVSAGSTATELPPATLDAPGDVAVWKLESPSATAPPSTTFTALVSRLGCSGGVTGEVLEPTVEASDTEIIVTFFVASLDSDLEQTCPGNDEVRYEVSLDEPIGDRPLLDGSCRSGGEAASTFFCAAGAARWVP